MFWEEYMEYLSGESEGYEDEQDYEHKIYIIV